MAQWIMLATINVTLSGLACSTVCLCLKTTVCLSPDWCRDANEHRGSRFRGGHSIVRYRIRKAKTWRCRVAPLQLFHVSPPSRVMSEETPPLSPLESWIVRHLHPF